MRRIKKRGTDKPIEIFIALFIILAVAMVILKMFSGQIQDKTKELAKIEQKEQFEQAKGDAKRECDEICTSVLQNDCNIQYKAQFCQHKLVNGLDINMDGNTKGYSQDLLGGIGICENSIYCPHVSQCVCNDDLTMSNCIDILWVYYREVMGMYDDEACELLYSRINGETCTYPPDTINWWPKIYNIIDNKDIINLEVPNPDLLKCLDVLEDS